MKLRLALIVIALAASVAWAGSSLEDVRARTTGLRGQVQALKSEQLSKRNALSVLSARIAVLKGQSKGSLLKKAELDSALKESQELSGVLSSLAKTIISREAELEAANGALLEELTTQLSADRARFDRETNRDTRKALITEMKALRTERNSVRAALPQTKIANLDSLKDSDDPEELLEQAELLHDNEEKVRKELKALEALIAERQQEAELDRRMQRFLGEESAFDDQDRRIRVQGTRVDLNAPTASSGANNSANGAQSGAPQAGATKGPDSRGFEGTSGTPASNVEASATDNVQPTGPQQPSSPVQGQLGESSIRVFNASDARPQVGAGGSNVSGGDDDLDDLDIQRVRLQKLADQLKAKAHELEQRATDGR